jgi:ComF family protein
MSVVPKILDLFFPRKCVFCRKILHSKESDWCEKCTETLPYTEYCSFIEGAYFDFCITPLYYKGEVREAMRRYKFRNAPIYAEAFGSMLAGCIKEFPDLWVTDALVPRPIYDIITWVPLSKKRIKTRGYDQAELLAEATAANLNDTATVTLEKSSDVRPQSELGDAKERRANIDGAYDVINPALIEEKCILLIDDIITTGSTLSECAKVLIDEGASRVICACMCRKD